MRRVLALPLLCLLAACGKPHAGRVEIDSDDCIPCHRDEYEAAQHPVHVGLVPETCGDCHDTRAWIPASAGQHPEASFAIASPPHQLACSDCHEPAPATAPSGQDTDCVGCHLGAHTLALMNPAHAAVASYAPDPAQPHFCLVCHPAGRK